MSQESPTMIGSRHGDWMVGVKKGATRRHPPSLVFEDGTKVYEVPMLWIGCQEIGAQLLEAFSEGVTLPVSDEQYLKAVELLAPAGLTLDETGCIEVFKET